MGSFLLATSFAYLAASIFSLKGKPALVGLNKNAQAVFYLVIGGILFYLALFPVNMFLKIGLGIFYSFSTVSSFTGYPQIWRAYWKSAPDTSSGSQAVGMAFWDLALAVAFFYLC
ncbi:MAG: hypothetical protein V3U97_05340 [bacterium]